MEVEDKYCFTNKFLRYHPRNYISLGLSALPFVHKIFTVDIFFLFLQVLLCLYALSWIILPQSINGASKIKM